MKFTGFIVNYIFDIYNSLDMDACMYEYFFKIYISTNRETCLYGDFELIYAVLFICSYH